jgi:hypothetical protein
MVHPPRAAEDDDDDFNAETVNFDKMSVRRRAMMRQDWSQETKQGELV